MARGYLAPRPDETCGYGIAGDREPAGPPTSARRVWTGAVVISADDGSPDAGASAPSGARPDEEAVRLLVRDVCHDLRQPLATIAALAEAALIHRGLPGSVGEQLEQILGQVRLASSLVIRLSDNRFEPAAIDLRTVVDGVAEHARLVYPGALRVVGAAEAPVVGDSLALSRALANLVDNAMRAAGPAGTIDIRLGRRSGWYVIDVSDSGPGFGRVPPGLANLGLQIAETVMRGHGGQLRISQNPHGGATVRLCLPAAQGQRP